MAIETISSMPAYQAIQTVQAPQPVKAEKEVSRDEGNGNLQDINSNVATVDSKTAVVASVNPEEDGKNGGQESYKEAQERDNEKIKKYVEDLSKKMNNSEVQFGIHEKTNRVTIKIVDKNTKDVIKELPPEKTLDMIAKVWEIAGIMVDEKR